MPETNKQTNKTYYPYNQLALLHLYISGSTLVSSPIITSQAQIPSGVSSVPTEQYCPLIIFLWFWNSPEDTSALWAIVTDYS